MRVKASHLCGGAKPGRQGLRASPEQVIGVSHAHWHLPVPAIWIAEGSTKGDWHVGSSLPREVLTPAPSSSRGSQFPPCPSLARQAAASVLELSEGASESARRPFKDARTPASLPPSWTESPLVLTARCEDSSAWHWYPGLGSLVWGSDPSLLRETSTAETSLPVPPGS